MRRGVLPLLVGWFAVTTWVEHAGAQPPPPASADAATRAQARKLGEEGLELFDQGNYEAALAKLEEADRLVAAPTLGLFAARCLVRIGRPVEAAERYLAVATAPLPSGASSVLRRAREEAEVERAEVLRRIPRLQVAVQGGAGAGAIVEIDGARADPSALAEGRALNPGSHRVVVVSGAARVEREVSLHSGETERIVVQLPAERPAAPAPPSTEPSSDHVLSWRTLGFIGIGVGGAGLSVWSVAGAVALARAGDLGCESGSCQAGPDDVDGLNAVRTTSAIGFWTGLVALGTGTALVLAAPRNGAGSAGNGRRVSAPRPSTRAWIGPGRVGLGRSF